MNIGPIATTSVMTMLQRARPADGARNVVRKMSVLMVYSLRMYMLDMSMALLTFTHFAGTYGGSVRSDGWESSRWLGTYRTGGGAGGEGSGRALHAGVGRCGGLGAEEHCYVWACDGVGVDAMCSLGCMGSSLHTSSSHVWEGDGVGVAAMRDMERKGFLTHSYMYPLTFFVVFYDVAMHRYLRLVVSGVRIDVDACMYRL